MFLLANPNGCGGLAPLLPSEADFSYTNSKSVALPRHQTRVAASVSWRSGVLPSTANWWRLLLVVKALRPRARVKYICGKFTLFTAYGGQITSPQRIVRSALMIRSALTTATHTTHPCKLIFQVVRHHAENSNAYNRKTGILRSALQSLKSFLQIQMAAVKSSSTAD